MAKRGAKKGNKKRKPAQIAKLKADIAKMFHEVTTDQSVIAWELSSEQYQHGRVSQQMVSHYLKQIKLEYQESAKQSMEEKKVSALADIEHLKCIYYAAWYRSIGKLEETAAGDPRFLQGVMSCFQEKNKINGIVAPIKFTKFDVNLSDPNISMEQLQRIRDGEDPTLVLYANQPGSRN